MTTFIRLREPTKIQYHLKLHPDLICSFQVKGNFLIQKNTSKVKVKCAEILPGFTVAHIHIELCQFLISNFSGFARTDTHTDTWTDAAKTIPAGAQLTLSNSKFLLKKI